MDALLLGEAATNGCRLDAGTLRGLLAMDIRLNAAGIAAWLATARTSSGPSE